MRMKLCVVPLLFLALCAQLAQPASAQQTPLRAPRGNQGRAPAAEATPALVSILSANLVSLPAIAADEAVHAMSIELSRAELQANARSLSALQSWVRNGGIVWLHTDAAQLFGYATVAARESTPQLAGQLFGRAQSALPFGGHPLLWGAVARAVTANGEAVTAASAVRTVFYQSRSGDHFVTGHPRGVALLRIVEAGGTSQVPLYAAAIAPYGRGWAIFTPAYVEPQRGDGALFLANLLSFANVPVAVGNAASARPPVTPDAFVAVPGAWLDAAAQAALGEGFNGAAQARALVAAMPTVTAAAGQTVTATPDAAAADAANDAATIAPLAMRASERNALWRALSGNAITARALVLVMRARLALQSGDLAAASRWHALAENIAPNATPVKVWGGAISAGEAADRTLASPARALLLQEAANQWNTALGSAPRVIVGDDDGEVAATPASPATPGNALGGMARDVVVLWAQEAAYAARLAAAEPPLVSLMGNVVVRFYQGDVSLRLTLPAAARLAAVSRTLGMAVEDEELLLFGTPEELIAYREARGGGGRGDAYGDVSGSKILMVSRPAAILFLPPLRTGGPRRPVQVGLSTPAIIGRLHGQVLVNRLAAGGTPVPVWMQVGLESIASQAVLADNVDASRILTALRARAATGQLLTPAQFEELAVTGGNETQTAAAEAQAASLVNFFAARYGAGTLIETLQRLGAGQDFASALDDTAGTDEETIFREWSRAAFGT